MDEKNIKVTQESTADGDDFDEYDDMELLEMLESLREDMEELGVTTLGEIIQRIDQLNRKLDRR